MENAPLLFLAFVFLSLHLGIKGATCPSFNITYPPMRTLLCPGDNITYTCSLIGSTNNGATTITTWTGSGFPCQTTSLSNTVFIPLSGGPLTTTPGSCGNVSAVTTNISGTCYTSVLTIPTPQYFNGTTVMCRDGSTDTLIGSETLNIQLASPPNTPDDILLKTVYSEELTVTWTPVLTATSYIVSISVTGTNPRPPIPSSERLEYRFTGLTRNTMYNVSVVAINCAGSSSPGIILITTGNGSADPSPTPSVTPSASTTSEPVDIALAVGVGVGVGVPVVLCLILVIVGVVYCTSKGGGNSSSKIRNEEGSPDHMDGSHPPSKPPRTKQSSPPAEAPKPAAGNPKPAPKPSAGLVYADVGQVKTKTNDSKSVQSSNKKADDGVAYSDLRH